MADADLVVIGAGPAGMAAARTAADAGARVIVLDEQPAAGGQIYRAVGQTTEALAAILGPDYRAGRDLVAALDHTNIRHLPGATVWRVDPDGTVCVSVAGRGRKLAGRRLLLATGALERPVPIPGWTLPGVMTAGAAQILLKTAAMVPRATVLAGSGPLLYLLAQQLVRAGRPPLALVETRLPSAWRAAWRHGPGAFRGWRTLARGAGMLAAIRRAGIPRYRGATGLAVEGAAQAEALRFTAGGREHRIPCRTVLLHQGVVPNIQITGALRLPHLWDAAQRCFRPVVDEWGGTALEMVFVAGDGAGIAGAGAAALAGRIAALQAVHGLGLIDAGARDAAAAPLRRALARERAARPLLDALYPPSPEVLRPDDATIVCRCEEVTAGEIRALAGLGCLGPNQLKAFSRAGMGPCQGRYCGLTVTELLAEATGRPPGEVGYYRLRTPLKPVTLGELADLAPPEVRA